MFLMFSNNFNVLISKIILKNKIGILFWVKNTLKNNHNYTPKHVVLDLKTWVSHGKSRQLKGEWENLKLRD